MNRVMLFVQNGGGRPTVRWVGASASRTALCYQRDEFRNAESVRRGGPVDAVPRWWLVECEDANHGRSCIVLWGDKPAPSCPTPTRLGRIIASGGKP